MVRQLKSILDQKDLLYELNGHVSTRNRQVERTYCQTAVTVIEPLSVEMFRHLFSDVSISISES